MVALPEGVPTGARSSVAEGRAKEPVAGVVGDPPLQADKRAKVIRDKKMARIIVVGFLRRNSV